MKLPGKTKGCGRNSHCFSILGVDTKAEKQKGRLPGGAGRSRIRIVSQVIRGSAEKKELPRECQILLERTNTKKSNLWIIFCYSTDGKLSNSCFSGRMRQKLIGSDVHERLVTGVKECIEL